MATFSEVLRSSVKREKLKLAKFEKLVKEGDVEGVHDFRVALRRIRSALRLLDGDREAKKLRKRATRFADAAGAVRDLDVLMLRKSVPDEWMLVLRIEKDKALSLAIDSLTGKQFRKWKRRLADWVGDKKADDSTSTGNLSSTLRANADGVLQLKGADDEEALHQLRIAVKRLRYTMEFFEDDLPRDLRPLIPRLVKVQDQLGDYHDVSVAIEKVTAAVQAADKLEVSHPLARYEEVLQREKSRMKPERAAAVAFDTGTKVREIVDE